MVFHMKTTLLIDDKIFMRIKEKATSEKTTISTLVESALRLFLQQGKSAKKSRLTPLPSFNGGECFVDISNREALYSKMEDK